MNRFLLALLVLVLSGAPAAAVICDLLVCADPRPSQSSCHEHAGSGGGQRIAATLDGCDHVALVAPYLTTVTGQIVDDAAAATTSIHAVHIVSSDGSPGDTARTHGPPSLPRTPSRLPLRI